jgi:hypothetical protein
VLLRCNYLLIIGLLFFVAVSQAQALSPLSQSGWALAAMDYPELDGHTVSIALVELSQPDSAHQAGFHFMPNLGHRALGGMSLTHLHYYRNRYRPTRYSPHATTIAGILFGQDAEAKVNGVEEFSYFGIVPEADLTIYETNWFIYKRILPHSRPVPEDILTISWGTDANDVMTQWWQRGIDALVVRDQCLVVAGCGNGNDQFHSITKPSSGYNVLSVGAASGLGGFPTNITTVGPPWIINSNYGPTDDGRSKPDCIAWGIHVSPDSLSRDQYIAPRDQQSYSSFAAPVVAGLAGLLIDAARQNELEGADEPRLIKALVLNGADKLTGWHQGFVTLEDDPFVPLDYAQGAGLINFSNSLEQLLAGRFDSQSPYNMGWDMMDIALNPEDSESQKIYLLPQPLDPNAQLKATLSWYRHYQQDKTFSPDPLSQIYLELWQVDDQGQLSLLLDQSISDLDNLQHIYYISDQQQSVALVVRSGENPRPNVSHERVALAFTTTDQNESGDLLSGDLNADGIIDIDDAQLLFMQIDHFAQENSFYPWDDQSFQTGDLNQDGTIDMKDFHELLQNLNRQSNWVLAESD